MKKIKHAHRPSIKRSSLGLVIGSLVPFLLTGCSFTMRDFNTEPELSPINADLGYVLSKGASRSSGAEGNYSLYHANANSFYRDPRATRPGDILTVLIAVNDRADINNKSDIKRDTDAKYALGADSRLLSFNGSLSGSTGAHAKGDGKIQRNENIRLSVAAVVTDVLPNGNLVIKGSQEIRVNYELRVLNVAGIVRPRDIAGNNTIDYDKIAEARVSYGGRGRVSEVQQTPYGQQLLNKVAPF